jgi:hypothetical protein
MNAGQLFAKADELSSSGDTAKAREMLRSLISRFPDHPLAPTAAQQIAMQSAAGSNVNAGVKSNLPSSAGSGSNATAQPSSGAGCWDVIAKKDQEHAAVHRRTLPEGATPGLLRIVWMIENTVKAIDTYCVGDAKAANFRKELQAQFNQIKAACEQLTAGGQCSGRAF